eukprot:g4518.t1
MADSWGGAGGSTSGGGGGGGDDEKLAQFMAVTGVTSEDIANHWLEANAFSLESAVNMFMESSASGAGGPAGSSGGGRIAGGSAGDGASASAGAGLSARDAAAVAAAAAGPRPGDPDYVRPADPYKRQRLVDDAGSNPYGGMATASRSWVGPAAPGTNPFRDFQEESRQALLASGHAFSAGKLGKTSSSDPKVAEKEKKLANMFSPPTSIMFMGDFQAARQAAKQQKKWLLVNIQADDEFDCHRLNRDLWKDEMVQNIIECNCIFWQQPSVSQEAKLYCQRYHASGYPHMALVDPRTGMKVWDFQGFLGPTEFIEKITDITDKISFEDGAPARLPPPPPRPPQLPLSTGGSEDQLLAAAIAASLDTSGGGGGGGGSSGDNSGSSGGVDAEKMGGGGGADGGGGGDGGGGAPVATVAGGAISVDGSDEDEEEGDANGDVAIVAPPPSSSAANAAAGAGVGGGAAGAAAAAAPVAAAAGGKPRRHGKGKAPEESAGGGGVRSNGAAAVGVGNGASAAGGSSGDVVDVTGDGVGEAGAGSNGTSGAEGSDEKTMEVEEQGQEDEEEELAEEAPGDDCPAADQTSVRFQFPGGARVLRKFRKVSAVRQLFLFVRAELEGAKNKPFDIRTVRPPSSIRSMEGSSIQEAGLANSAVVVVWED